MFSKIVGFVRHAADVAVTGVKVVGATVALALGVGSVSSAVSTPAHATGIDLTGVTGPITDLSGALIVAAGAAITAGLGCAALYFGGRWVWRVFKSFTK